MSSTRKTGTAWLTVIFGMVISGAGVYSQPAPAENHPIVKGEKGRTALSLGDLEQKALQGNPTLAQAAAAVDASRGKALQAGLYPNPTIGYVGEQIGIAGTAGELQGAFVQQTIVTAGKLRLSRAKYNQEAYEAEIRALGQQ
jgi:cobalt-zinc-cadmium efflux system outer membrane protein